jgi:site-specific DNA-cytosine methylase
MVGRDDVVNASVSLFSSAGIGDLGIEYGCDIPVVLSAELNEKRADLISNNYPEGIVIRGDIVKTKAIIISSTKKILAKKRPLLVTLSPPFQGMSTNGAGKISAQVKKGK